MAPKTSKSTTSTSNVSLGLAVQTRDTAMVQTVVQNAIAIVANAEIKATGVDVSVGAEAVQAVVSVMAAPQPKVPNIETVHGAMPLTSIFDEDTIWAQVDAEYANLVQRIQHLPEEGKALAVAKLIASNAVLRNLGTEPTATIDGLI